MFRVDAIAVALKSVAQRPPIPGFYSNDDGLGLRASAQRLAHAAIDLAIGSLSNAGDRREHREQGGEDSTRESARGHNDGFPQQVGGQSSAGAAGCVETAEL
jgi:hypothetical protein